MINGGKCWAKNNQFTRTNKFLHFWNAYNFALLINITDTYLTSLTIIVANLQIGGESGVAQGAHRLVVGTMSVLSVGFVDFRGSKLLCQGPDALFLPGDTGKMQGCVSMTIPHRGLFK